jgi:hypothetical protein
MLKQIRIPMIDLNFISHLLWLIILKPKYYTHFFCYKLLCDASIYCWGNGGSMMTI